MNHYIAKKRKLTLENGSAENLPTGLLTHTLNLENVI